MCLQLSVPHKLCQQECCSSVHSQETALDTAFTHLLTPLVLTGHGADLGQEGQM